MIYIQNKQWRLRNNGFSLLIPYILKQKHSIHFEITRWIGSIFDWFDDQLCITSQTAPIAFMEHLACFPGWGCVLRMACVAWSTRIVPYAIISSIFRERVKDWSPIPNMSGSRGVILNGIECESQLVRDLKKSRSLTQSAPQSHPYSCPIELQCSKKNSCN